MSSSKLLPRRTLRLSQLQVCNTGAKTTLRDSCPLVLYHHSMSAKMRGKDDVDIVELLGGDKRCGVRD